MAYTLGLGVNMDGFQVDLRKLEDLIRYGAKRKSEFNEDLEDKFYDVINRILREYVGKVVVPVFGSKDQGLEIKWYGIHY